MHWGAEEVIFNRFFGETLEKFSSSTLTFPPMLIPSCDASGLVDTDQFKETDLPLFPVAPSSP